MSVKDEIIQLIKKNRISTTEVADALGKSGSIPGLTPLAHLRHEVGKICLITPNSDSNFRLHADLDRVAPGDILYIKPLDFSDIAVFGDLIAKYAILYKQARAIVVEGFVRDTARLVREGYPIWTMGSNPVGAVNFERPLNRVIPDMSELSGGVAVCDEGGVVVIPKSHITQSVYDQLCYIEGLEDLWHYCLNTLKWSTFDIVVKKRYLDEPDAVPARLLKIAKEMEGRSNEQH